MQTDHTKCSTSSLTPTTEQLFRSHARFVRRLLMRLGLPDEGAEDALQDVFLTVHQRGGYRPGAAKPTTYLAGIAIHAALNQHRRKRVDAARYVDVDADRTPSAASDPADVCQLRQEVARVRSALERLPEVLRATLLLVDVAGESCVNVASDLCLPVGTVYSRQHSAHKKLHAIMRKLEVERRTRCTVSGNASVRAHSTVTPGRLGNSCSR